MKLTKFKDWNIFAKILSLIVFVIVPFVLFLYVFFLPDVKKDFMAAKEQNIKNTVEVAYSIVQQFSEKAKKGELPLQEAKEKAKEMLKQIRYEKDIYFFISDPNAFCVMHPIQTEMEGKSMAEKKDPNGIYLFIEFAKIAKAKGEGIVHYMWPKPGFDKPVPKITYVKLYEEFGWIIGSGIYVDDVDVIIGKMSSSLLLILFIATIIAVFFSVLIARFISSKIRILNSAAQKIAGGDITVNVNIQSEDEIGSLSRSFQKMVENIRHSMNEIEEKSKAAEKAAKEANEAQLAAKKQEDYLARSANAMLSEMDKFAEGDLTVSLKAENANDVIGKLFNGFNASVANLREVMKNVTEVAALAASASAEISSTTEQLATGAQEQSAQTSDVATAVEEMTKTILATASNANNVSSSSKDVNEQARIGVQKVNENKKGIQRIIGSAGKTGQIIASLAGKTDQIGEIARVIDDIANQTNLLALNAAIEAARAGEQGRGFAVVADEVRKLAERTTKATKEIAETISAIQKEAQEADNSMIEAKDAVDAGKTLTDELESALVTILNSMKNLTLEIEQVAAASEEQSTTAEQISKNIELINSVTNETSNGITQIAKASEDLQQITENLNNQVGAFKVDNLQKRNNITASNQNRRLIK